MNVSILLDDARCSVAHVGFLEGTCPAWSGPARASRIVPMKLGVDPSGSTPFLSACPLAASIADSSGVRIAADTRWLCDVAAWNGARNRRRKEVTGDSKQRQKIADISRVRTPTAR